MIGRKKAKTTRKAFILLAMPIAKKKKDVLKNILTVIVHIMKTSRVQNNIGKSL